MATRDQRIERLEQDREREADALGTQIDDLETRAKALKARRRRLEKPADVDELKRLAEGGEELGQAEVALIALDDPDAYNDLFERSI